jgi:hypothetical protein
MFCRIVLDIIIMMNFYEHLHAPRRAHATGIGGAQRLGLAKAEARSETALR